MGRQRDFCGAKRTGAHNARVLVAQAVGAALKSIVAHNKWGAAVHLCELHTDRGRPDVAQAVDELAQRTAWGRAGYVG